MIANGALPAYSCYSAPLFFCSLGVSCLRCRYGNRTVVPWHRLLSLWQAQLVSKKPTSPWQLSAQAVEQKDVAPTGHAVLEKSMSGWTAESE